MERHTLKAACGVAEQGDDGDGKSTDHGGPISADQMEIIRALIDATGTDIEKFCAYMQVEAVPDITVGQFPRAVAMLEKKRGAK